MLRFSERRGYKTVRIEVQKESMDEDLKIGLWNVLTVCYWGKVKYPYLSEDSQIEILVRSLWINYFKIPMDMLGDNWPKAHDRIRNYFLECNWYEAYDFIEFCASHYPDENVNNQFTSFCNQVLRKEMSAYRFVDSLITEITSDEEIAEIEEAANLKKTKLTPVSAHIESALQKLSDKQKPDYRNSIKESISAVESICRLITGKTTATLGDALKRIDDVVPIHQALQAGFIKIYGYTSDANGIRHSMMDDPNITFEDAKYMLVACSAFVNYLIVKADEAGISFA